MKKLRFVILTIACFTCACTTHSQQLLMCWGTNSVAGSAGTITVAVTPTGGTGHSLVSVASSGTNTTDTWSDNSGSNSWATISALTANHSPNGWAQDAHSDNAVGGSYTVTVTFGVNATFRAVTVCEISGLISVSPLDTTASTANATAGFSESSCVRFIFH